MNAPCRVAVLLALVAASCHRAPPPNPHYVLGQPYQAGGVWYYPRERYEATETGLAAIYPSDHADLTADGERFDQSAMAASHQILQLPAIARLTNLENGRQVLVRINDRGPATPHRMIEVTRRVATLLAMPSSGGTRVRLQILPRESHEAADAMPDAPKLAVTAAPRGEVQQSDLPLPGSAATVTARAAPVAAPEKAAPAALPETRLPESLTQGVADPGNLYVQLSTFHNVQYADIQRARVGGLGARIVSESDGRLQTHRVIIGPFTTVQQADVALDQVLRAGVTDARIVVE